jgi:hypothetical protein
MRIGLPTAARVRVREKRRTRAAVDNPQPAEIAPYRTPQNCLNEWGHFSLRISFAAAIARIASIRPTGVPWQTGGGARHSLAKDRRSSPT